MCLTTDCGVGLRCITNCLSFAAMTHDNSRNPIRGMFMGAGQADPFNYGSGHINPTAAMYPGLVYDLNVTDYLNLLCSIGYSSSQMAAFDNGTYSCPSKALDIKDFNYPSISVPGLNGSITVERRVKNVGSPGTYRVQISEPEGISVSIKPDTLEFKSVGEEKKFEVTLNGTAGGEPAFGKLTWSDGKHFVGSPIAVFSVPSPVPSPPF